MAHRKMRNHKDDADQDQDPAGDLVSVDKGDQANQDDQGLP